MPRELPHLRVMPKLPFRTTHCHRVGHRPESASLDIRANPDIFHIVNILDNKIKWVDFNERLLRLNLPVFTLREALRILGLSYDTGRMQISRWVRIGYLTRLKNGLYVLNGPLGRGEISNYYIASRLYFPSYVSLETALSFYNLVPEIPFSVTSISSKPTRKFSVAQTPYLYRSVQPRFLTGYVVEKQKGFSIRIAEKEKAVVDYLYFTIIGKMSTLERLTLKGLNRKKMRDYASLAKGEEIMSLIRRLC